MSKAIVLFSGGLDSTICLFLAKLIYDEVVALTIDYRQRNRSEIKASKEISIMAKINDHLIISFDSLNQIEDSSLFRKDSLLGESDYEAPVSFVPGRNLMFYGIAGSLAVKLKTKDLISGTNEPNTSPDCYRIFCDAMEKALTLAMPDNCRPLRIITPFMYINKSEIIRIGKRINGCWDVIKFTVTCYEGTIPGCGKCLACKLRSDGFKAAGLIDPAFQL